MKFLDEFSDWSDLVEFKAGHVIFTEKDQADVMYVVLKGEVEITLHGEPLGAEGPGGIIGEMAMINATTRSASATTLTKVKLARLNREQFREFVGENAEFALHVMSVLANRLRAINEYITTQFAQFR
jgi:CRP-like cAMP-binding protein